MNEVAPEMLEIARRLSSHSLSMGVLWMLHTCGPLTSGEIADHLFAERTTVWRTLKRLESPQYESVEHAGRSPHFLYSITYGGLQSLRTALDRRLGILFHDDLIESAKLHDLEPIFQRVLNDAAPELVIWAMSEAEYEAAVSEFRLQQQLRKVSDKALLDEIKRRGLPEWSSLKAS